MLSVADQSILRLEAGDDLYARCQPKQAQRPHFESGFRTALI